jgi:hypothetical protein
MRRILIILTLLASILAVSACTEIVIDEIKTLQVTNLNVEEFAVDSEIDLSKIKVTVVYTDDSDREDETLDLDEVNFYLRGPDNALIDVERTAGLKFTPEDAGTYSLYVSYGGVSVTITFDVPGDATDIQLVWDGNYPTGKPETFKKAGTDVILEDARALAWFAKTLNDEDSSTILDDDSTILRENEYEGFTVKLEADIDLGGKVWTPIGTVVPFKGSFDGGIYHDDELIGRHTISNLRLSDDPVTATTLYTTFPNKTIKSGLFYSLGHSGDMITVKNLTIGLSNVSPEVDEDGGTLILQSSGDTVPNFGYNIGALAQIGINTTVDNVHVEGVEYTIDLQNYLEGEDTEATLTGSSLDFGGLIGEVYGTWASSIEYNNSPSVVINDSTVEGFDLTFKNANHKGAFNLGGVVGYTGFTQSSGGTLTITGTVDVVICAHFNLNTTAGSIAELMSRFAGLAFGSGVIVDSSSVLDLDDIYFTVTDPNPNVNGPHTISFNDKFGPYTDDEGVEHSTFTFDETGSNTVSELYNAMIDTTDD